MSLSNIIYITLGSIILGLLLFCGYEMYTKSLLQTQVANQQIQITSLSDANDQWKTQTLAANTALKSIQNSQDARDKAAQAAMAQAVKDAQSHEAEAQVILKKKVTGDDCTAANKIFNDYLGGHK